MQKSKFSISPLNIAGIFVLVIALVAVRIFQTRLFYDPLLEFFKHEDKILPDYDSFRLFLSLAFRYLLNSIISLGILWLAFKDVQIIKLCIILFGIFFVILAVVLFIVLGNSNPSLLLVFYVRRFLIQPLFVVLFFPAFYYQKHVK